MDHQLIERLKQSHPAWRLLNAENAPLVLSFLLLVFIQPNRRAMAAPELTAHLDSYLDQLRETHGEQRYPKAAKEYLDDWASSDRAWLRKYYPRSGEDAEFDLTPAAERAIEWARGLMPTRFVGTESRLLTLLNLVRDLAAGSQEDPALRIAELQRKKAEIEREIERVRSGEAGPLDQTQVKERYAQVLDIARRLLSDFRQVEENFRLVDVQTRERIAVSARPKGMLLQEIFGETDHIRQSDQGKSFEAFWEFLMSPARQDELRAWLGTVQELDAVREDSAESFLHDMPVLLLDAGEKVHVTVSHLVEQLRRFVDDQVHLESKRILELIRAIENHAIRLKAAPPQGEAFTGIAGFAPEFNLPMCRALYRPARATSLKEWNVEAGDADLDLAKLFSQTIVDEMLLREHIAVLLRAQRQVTLAEVVEAFPPEQGLAEVVTYLRVAAKDHAAVDESVIEELTVPASAERPRKVVRLPRVIFTA